MFFCLWYHAGMCLYIIYFCVFCEHEDICALGVSMFVLNLRVSEHMLLRHASWLLCIRVFLWVMIVRLHVCVYGLNLCVCVCACMCVQHWRSPWRRAS